MWANKVWLLVWAGIYLGATFCVLVSAEREHLYDKSGAIPIGRRFIG